MSGFAAQSKPKLLCVGDSLTAGYYAWGSEWYPYGTTLSSLWNERYEVDHIGYSGWTTEKMLYSAHKEFTWDVCDMKWPGIDVQLQQYGPYEYVLLLAGTNDLAQEDAPTILSNLQALTDKFLTRANYVGLLTVPTMGAETTREGIRLIRTAVNNGLVEMTKTNPSRLFLVDTSAALPQIEGDEESMALWDQDKLHLSEKGGQVIARTVFAAMQSFQLSLQPSLPPAATAADTTTV